MRDGPTKPKTFGQPMTGAQDEGDVAIDDETVFPTARGVLTAAEIEALLRPETLAADPSTSNAAPEVIVPKPTPRFEESAVSERDVDTEAYRRLGARLSRALAIGAGLKASVTLSQSATIARDQLTGLMNGKSSAIACLGPTEHDIHALVCLPPMLADAIIAKACGARGSTGRIGDGWTLSAIDCALLEQLLVPIGGVIGEGLKLQSIETDIPYVSSLLASTDVSIGEFAVEAPGLHSDLAIIQSNATDIDQPRDVATPDAMPVTTVLTARLASLTVPLSRITELKAGSTLLLGLPADQPVELLSGGRDGKTAFEGRMGRKGQKMAVKIQKKSRTFGA